MENNLNIRRFNDDDAFFCYQTRKQAFLNVFVEEIGKKAAQAGADAYQPDDYIRIAGESEFFIAEYHSNSVGFFIIIRIDDLTAELKLIYFDLMSVKQGFGRQCSAYIDKWVMNQWPEVDRIYVDTIIPKYNTGFYNKIGYTESGLTTCEFPDASIEAVRFEKRLGSDASSGG